MYYEMQKEFLDLLETLNNVHTTGDLLGIYQKFHTGRRWWTDLNEPLGLVAEATEIQRDLPCLYVGSLKGIVVVGANPGFSQDRDEKKESYSAESFDNYLSITNRYFRKYPEVVGKPSKWWSRALQYVPLLHHQCSAGFPSHRSDRWEWADESGMVGGWDIFPFHSTSDGMTGKIFDARYEKLLDYAVASLRCIRRLGPRVILIASKQGYVLTRLIFSDLAWRTSGELGFPVSYAEFGGGHAIVAIGRQVLAGQASRKASEIIAVVDGLRSLRS